MVKKILILILLITVSLNISALPKTNVQDSVITNEVSGNTSAKYLSNVNRGIEAKGADIKDSYIENKSTGNINARYGSTVNTGVKANGATIDNSVISTKSSGNINAVHSNVGTGVDIYGAKNSDLSTNFKGSINAVGSNVNVGTIKGSASHQKISTNVGTNVNAAGRTVNLGTVTVQSGYGKPSYKERHADVSTDASSNIGNVYVSGNRTREVDTTVGSGAAGYGSSVKVRHMAKVYEKTGGVDPSGTKYTYVSKAQRTKAENEKHGAVGNTYTSGGVRKVRTHVE